MAVDDNRSRVANVVSIRGDLQVNVSAPPPASTRTCAGPSSSGSPWLLMAAVR